MNSWLDRLISRHPLADEDLSAFVDARMHEPDVARVRAHMETCEACRAKVAELGSVKSLLAAMPDAEPPRSFALTAEQAGRPAPPARQPAPRRQRLVFAPVMAMTVLLLLVAVDVGVMGGGAGGGDEAGGLAATEFNRSEDSTSSGAQPATDVARQVAGTPSVPALAGAGAAEGPAPAAPGREAPTPVRTDRPPAVPRDEPAKAGETRSPSPATEDQGSDRTVIRLLEGLAALALAGSLAYAYFTWRRPEPR